MIPIQRPFPRSPLASCNVPAHLLLTLTLIFTLAGCPPKSRSVVPMRIGNTTFQLEVANTDAVRAKGLMNRSTMPADHGMIFVFGKEQVQSFWMKNTLIPLDIIFISGDGRVVSVRQMKPLVEDPATSSTLPAKWAIELSDGAAARSGVSVGDVLSIPADAQDAVN